jgi:hypothetical protein
MRGKVLHAEGLGLSRTFPQQLRFWFTDVSPSKSSSEPSAVITMGSTVDQKAPHSRTKTNKTKATQHLDKKRIQNRTSQQCLRERKQAHTRHLESLAELMMVSQNDGADPEKQNRVLAASNLKLIEQNRQLQDALFRMKKKLMGLSNMATAAASGSSPFKLNSSKRLFYEL